MLPLIPIIASLVSSVPGIMNIFSGKDKQKEAQDMYNNNPRPTYEIPRGEFENQALLENRANQGLSDSSMQAYNQQNERALASSLNAILRSGGNVNMAGQLGDNFTNGTARLAAMNDQAKSANIAALVDQRRRMSDYEDKSFQVNKYAPYADKAAAARLLQQQGDNQYQQGLGTVYGAAGSAINTMATQAATADMWNKFLGQLNKKHEPIDIMKMPTNQLQPIPGTYKNYERPDILELLKIPH